MTTLEAGERPAPAAQPETEPAMPRTGVLGSGSPESGCCPPPVAPPLSAAAAVQHAAALKALADPSRLRILSLIAAQPAHAPLCVCEIEEGFDLTQGTISHHLRVLREAGLVTATKRGQWHYYTLAPEGLAPLKALLGSFDAV